MRHPHIALTLADAILLGSLFMTIFWHERQRGQWHSQVLFWSNDRINTQESHLSPHVPQSLQQMTLDLVLFFGSDACG